MRTLITLMVLILALSLTSGAIAGYIGPTDFGLIQNGMNEMEVLDRLGTPDMTSGSPKGDVQRWYWIGDGHGQKVITLIEFWHGRVHDKERKYQ